MSVTGVVDLACRDGDPNGIYSYSRPDWLRETPVQELGRKPSVEEMNDELRPTWPCDPWKIGYGEVTGLTDSAFKRIGQLESAIRNHRDQRGDDRCWMDDEELYKVLPEGYTAPARDTEVELKLCEKFISCRKNPATAYVSPQRRIEELEAELEQLKQKYQLRCQEISQTLYKERYGAQP